MKLHLDTSEIFVPDDLPVEAALGRTTHMAVSAHQDDIEIMAARPILDCFQQKDKWFTGVVVTDGRGSPRDGLYKEYDDEEMRLVRFKEQRKAALVGEYAAQVMLDYPSKVVKDGSATEPGDDLALLLAAARPVEVYTHNLADKHDTHVATALARDCRDPLFADGPTPGEALRLRSVALTRLDDGRRQGRHGPFRA